MFVRLPKWLVTALVVVLAVSLVGCDSNGLPVGGVLSWGVTREPTLLNPLLASDPVTQEVTARIFEGLIGYDGDMELVGVLAKRWTISEDRLTWTFELHENVIWHDGQPFTAADVEFTFNSAVLFSLPNGATASALTAVLETVTAQDEHTVAFQLNRPYGPFMHYVMVPIIPRHIFDPELYHDGGYTSVTEMASHPRINQPVGTGPWKFESWTPGDYIRLERNSDYHLPPQPYIQTLYYRFLANQEVALAALANGDVDVLSGIPPATAQSTMAELGATHHFHTTVSRSYWYLGFNHRADAFISGLNPWLNDDVRTAVAHAIDRSAMVDTVLHGYGTVMDSWIPPGSWAYSPHVPHHEYNPDKASHLLSQAGWEYWDSHGDVRARNLSSTGTPVWQTFSLSLAYPRDVGVAASAAALIKKNLGAVGIEVQLHPLSTKDLLESHVLPGKYELVLMNWGLSEEPDPYQIFFSGQPANYGNYRNPLADELLDLGRSTIGRAVRAEIYKDLQTELALDLPYVFLFAPNTVTATKKNIYGIEPACFSLNNPKNWYFKQ